jgi:CRISPR system Cascade subunit CasA
MTYNLLHKPWLPVRWRGGGPPTEVGLRDALVRAHDIEELATDNPLETIALNRLLAALTAAVFPELAEESDWLDCWEHNYFDVGRCDAYFADYANRFDLLSETRPFYGHPVTDSKEVSPVSRMLHAAASGNNAVLFSHDLDSVSRPMTLAEAARALVCTQAAALGGGVAKPFNLSHGPLVGGAYFWLRGLVREKPSLFHALLLNLAPGAQVWGNTNGDHPTWEAETPPVAQKRDVGGIRDLFTFQSRRLQVVPDSNGQVRGVHYNQGSKIEELLFHDPHAAYKLGKEGPYPLRFSTGHALWQDSAAYMLAIEKKGEGGHAPRTFEWLTDPAYLDALGLDETAAFAADVFGMVNDQAKVELWRQERITIYPDILTNVDRWDALNRLVEEAQLTSKRLREATRAFAVRARLNKPWGVRLSDVERGDMDAFVQALATDSRYWPALGQQFNRFLAEVATVPVDDLDAVRQTWQRFAHDTSQNALKGVLENYQLSDSGWQAMAEAETVLRIGTLYPKSRKTESV